MGCDYYADDFDEFEIEIIDYKTGKVLQVVSLKNVQMIDIEVNKGRMR